MPLKPGTRLGPYEILTLIGAGGMGEVYKGLDTRLNRTVAIKVLPAHLAEQTELRERFQREAETIANLKHPNICVLYDIGQQDGIPGQPGAVHFLVMEYLEGETLGQRLLKAPMPLEQVLRYATEVSDALEKAHGKGVTHRDVKPGNIMLTKEGSKLMDFGLAKLKQAMARPNIPQSELPTEPSALTQGGTILGTLQYMAPEQVEGKIDELDGRTDIFAFGAVVYEMMTGKKAFEGKTSASLIGAIMKDDPPPMSSLQPMTPPALDRVVKTCLAKDPDERWQTARDLRRELKWIRESTLQAAVPVGLAVKEAPAGWQRKLVWGLVGLAACALTAIAVWNLRPTPATGSQQVSRSVIPLATNERLGGVNAEILALSPDGTDLAYVAVGSAGNQQLYLRSMDELAATPLAGTEGAESPFFSPDGQWIGFFVGAKLKKISVSGGAALALCNIIGTQRGAAWGPSDTIVFSPANGSRLWAVSAAGGEPQPFTSLEQGEASHRWPQFLPDGKTVVFTAGRGGSFDDAQIAVQRLGTTERQILIRGGTYARYVPTGHLVYYRAGILMAVPFDPVELAVKGSPAPVVEAVMGDPGIGAAQFSVSNTGSLAYVAGGPQSINLTLVWVDRQGAAQPLPAPLRTYRAPRLSPDGRQVAVGIGPDVWIYDIPRDTLTRFTFEGNNANTASLWTPDGKRVVFPSNRAGGVDNLFWKPADGSGPEERLTTSKNTQRAGSFSPDGRTEIYSEVDPKTGQDLWVLPLDGDRKPQVFLQTPFNESSAQISPDGHWVAYVSDESGRLEVYVRPFPGPSGKWQVSNEGGSEIAWSPKGNELFYRTGPQKEKMMVVDVQTQPTFTAGKPRLLFEETYVANTGGAGAMYSVSPDAQRFLMMKPSEQQQAALTQINVVQNWFEELKKRVPAGQ